MYTLDSKLHVLHYTFIAPCFAGASSPTCPRQHLVASSVFSCLKTYAMVTTPSVQLLRMHELRGCIMKVPPLLVRLDMSTACCREIVSSFPVKALPWPSLHSTKKFRPTHVS